MEATELAERMAEDCDDATLESVSVSSIDNLNRSKLELEEMLAVRTEQDALITRLREDNVQLANTVANLEIALCTLQAKIRRQRQQHQQQLQWPPPPSQQASVSQNRTKVAGQTTEVSDKLEPAVEMSQHVSSTSLSVLQEDADDIDREKGHGADNHKAACNEDNHIRNHNGHHIHKGICTRSRTTGQGQQLKDSDQSKGHGGAGGGGAGADGDIKIHDDTLEPEADDMVVLEGHLHCTVDICWRQKYTESLGQLRSLLVELRNELEERRPSAEDNQLESASNAVAAKEKETRRRSKVKQIEESIRTLDVEGNIPDETSSRTRSRKRALLGLYGLDSSLRRVKLSRTSESQSSLSKAPLLKRMISLFKKKPT